MYSHLNALQLRLSHEKTMLSKATAASEKALRSVWVNQIEKEIQGEYKFLNIVPFECSLSDDELLKELNV